MADVNIFEDLNFGRGAVTVVAGALCTDRNCEAMRRKFRMKLCECVIWCV